VPYVKAIAAADWIAAEDNGVAAGGVGAGGKRERVGEGGRVGEVAAAAAGGVAVPVHIAGAPRSAGGRSARARGRAVGIPIKTTGERGQLPVRPVRGEQGRCHRGSRCKQNTASPQPFAAPALWAHTRHFHTVPDVMMQSPAEIKKPGKSTWTRTDLSSSPAQLTAYARLVSQIGPDGSAATPVYPPRRIPTRGIKLVPPPV
jgi:hypothetical protein